MKKKKRFTIEWDRNIDGLIVGHWVNSNDGKYINYFVAQ